MKPPPKGDRKDGRLLTTWQRSIFEEGKEIKEWKSIWLEGFRREIEEDI